MCSTPSTVADGPDPKLERLRERVRGYGSMLVAYSGGVDSTFLMHVAADVLGERAVAVTAASPVFPAWERREAVELAGTMGWRHRVVAADPMCVPGFAENPPDRCYLCKRALFAAFMEVARAEQLAVVADGNTRDDLADFRPGRRATAELGVVSPLLDAELSKQQIRELSRRAGLPTCDKPSVACLASRVPYGEEITAEKLRQVDAAEDCLRELGFGQCRVRHHGHVARIEVPPEHIDRLAGELRAQVVDRFRTIGFRYVAADLQGYRTGSMNAVLPKMRD